MQSFNLPALKMKKWPPNNGISLSIFQLFEFLRQNYFIIFLNFRAQKNVKLYSKCVNEEWDKMATSFLLKISNY